ncbi:hypothetical protein KW842_07765 [Duganella sp. sic0402]|uniref:hypothetical protein n=1 Tax=Duganella sp. sic0402 TaxID=2854786 RepID=UPI001C44607B|nr:hypothetical protein [Duganella sp. sic0402]MBV7535657.1 hypothetical protein [Duganella sp. sic0402]
MRKIKISVLLSALLACMSVHAAEPTANAEIIKLLEAKMPESVVLGAIDKSTARFDTSANALIRLKDKGASAAVLNAVLGAGSGGAKTAASKPAAASNERNPEVVSVVVDGNESQMQYIIPQQRTAARALGFGGVATYAQLNGTNAQLQIANPSPEFIVSVPKNAQPQNYLTLANFAVGKNAREVMIGGGYMSYSTGIHKDRVRAVKTEVLPDQSRAKEGFVLVKVSPEAPLSKGEYALVLYTGEIRSIGYFAQAANSYYDFSVQ